MEPKHEILIHRLVLKGSNTLQSKQSPIKMKKSTNHLTLAFYCHYDAQSKCLRTRAGNTRLHVTDVQSARIYETTNI